MKILITGATGFLASALCPALRGRGHSLTAADSKNCNLTNESSLHQFDDLQFDRIFHLAAWTQAGDFCLHHSGEQWIINQKINTNMLSWWQKHQSQAQLISIGTSCAYDPNQKLVEENYLFGTPIDSLFTYAMSKRMLYTGQLALNKQYGLKSLTVVPSTLYGPEYPLKGQQLHFIFDLIRKIIRGKTHGDPVVLWGDGFQKRELIHIDDFVRIMLQLADAGHTDLINVGSGEEFTIRDFASIICAKLEYDFEKIRFDAGRYVGATSKCLDIRKLQGIIPDLRLTPLEQGLSQTIESFWNQRERLMSQI